MKPKRIILVRHGESQGNVNRDAYKDTPDYAIPLTAKGKMQASNRGVELKRLIGNESLFCYFSSFRRTRETFQEIYRAFEPGQVGHREDPRLREQEWNTGLSPFDSEQEAKRNAYGVFYYRFQNGESCADVFDRTSTFLDTLFRDFEKKEFPDNCAIISHGMQIRVFLMRWFRMTVEEFEMLANPHNAQAIILNRQQDGKYKLDRELLKYKEPLHKFQFPLNLN